MKIATGAFAIIATLSMLIAGSCGADAGQHRACRSGGHCAPHNHVRPHSGWFDFRFFGDFSGPCGPLLRKAIEIDTPDPRYWNAYDACIGLRLAGSLPAHRFG